jgi:predicted transcriptional regulator
LFECKTTILIKNNSYCAISSVSKHRWKLFYMIWLALYATVTYSSTQFGTFISADTEQINAFKFQVRSTFKKGKNSSKSYKNSVSKLQYQPKVQPKLSLKQNIYERLITEAGYTENTNLNLLKKAKICENPPVFLVIF